MASAAESVSPAPAPTPAAPPSSGPPAAALSKETSTAVGKPSPGRREARGRRGGNGNGNNAHGTGPGPGEEAGGSSERRRRPEVQHYKPPGAIKQHKDEGEQKGDASEALTSCQVSGEPKEPRERKEHSRGKGGRRKEQQQQQSQDVDQLTVKVDKLAVVDEAPGAAGADDPQASSGGGGGRKKKKPEQAHYVAKKSVGEEAGKDKTDDAGKSDVTATGTGQRKKRGGGRKPNANVATDETAGKEHKPAAAHDQKQQEQKQSQGSRGKRTGEHKQHNGFATPEEQGLGHPQSQQQQPRQQQQQQVRRGGLEDNLPPRMRKEQDGQHGGGGGSRGSRQFRRGGGAPHGRSSPRPSSDRDRASPGASGAPGAAGSTGQRRSQTPPSTASQQVLADTRRSLSPSGSSSHRGGASSARGGSAMRRGGSRDAGDAWGQRGYFGRNDYDHQWAPPEDLGRDRGGSAPRGGGGRFRGGGGGPQSQSAPKATIAPRFLRAREQQQQMQQRGHSASGDEDDHDGGRRGGQHRLWKPSDEPQSMSRTSISSHHHPVLDRVESCVSDWSVEVEEEEERQHEFHRRASLDHGRPTSGNPAFSAARGIIHLPKASSAASDPHGNDDGPRSLPVMDSSNPAWRGASAEPPAANRMGVWGSGPPAQHQRFLFDPKNPNKPIPAPSMGHHRMAAHDSGLAAPAPMRFSMDPRFPPRVMGPPTGHPGHASGYRPPFPSAQAAQSMSASAMYGPPRPPVMPNVPEWYNVMDMRIYGTDTKHDVNVITFLGRNDFLLRKIIMEGGGKLLCHLWNEDVKNIRKHIISAFEHLLKNDLMFCAENDVEFHIWKVAFYQLVEALKFTLKDESLSPSERDAVQRNMVSLLNEGLDIYERMLDTLDNTYSLGLDTYYDVLEPRPSDKRVQIALVSAQKCLLCLGDLARYKEQIQGTSNYGQARQYYQKASNVEPRNGRPFNQLAILAFQTKRKFEAVYYNMRCLQSKNPFPSSQESLTLIFEDMKKKWELAEKKRLEERDLRDREKDGFRLVRGTRLRREIWMHPDGAGRRLHRTTSAQSNGVDSAPSAAQAAEAASEEAESAELASLSTADLNRRFINTYLYLLGKLYTNINMDSFPLALELLSKEFRVLVSRSPLPIDSKRLVQIMALNMFIIEHTKMKSGDSARYRSAMQDAALQLSFEMFSVLVERCNNLLDTFKPVLDASSQFLFSEEDLPTLLSAVKVWCDWLLGNNDTWYPVVKEEPFTQLARLATHLENLKPLLRPVLDTFVSEERYSATSGGEKAFELVKLGEDALLCGFGPWFGGLDWSVYRRYCPRAVPATLAQDARRLDAINFCVDFLEGLEPPILKWSLPDNAHISLVETATSTQEKVSSRLAKMLASDQDVLEESYSDDDLPLAASMMATASPNAGPGLDEKHSRLKVRKDELERVRQEEEREARRMQRQILSEHVSVTLEVVPRVVMPDTNCFVDHLSEIRRLAQTGPFQVVVPLVVLAELDGLAKGSARYASRQHAAMVQDNARRAMAFLRGERTPNLRCVTSKGTPVHNLGVITEEDSGDGKSNDDLILDACLLVSSGKEERSGKMRVLYRDVVLLTDDRNLKVKAHVADVPVNKIADFVKWAFGSHQPQQS